jgi:hypothetical protein
MQLTSTSAQAVLARSVRYLTKNAVFAMDIGAALQDAGLAGVTACSGHARAQGVIVDLDGLDRQSLAILRWHRRAGVATVAISDDPEAIRHQAGPAARACRKPVRGDTLGAALIQLMRRD